MLKLIELFEAGEGNYTEERDATCGGTSVDEIADMIQKSEASSHVG